MLQLRLLRPSLGSLPLLPSLGRRPTTRTTRQVSSNASDGINTDRGEYSKTGGDSEVASQRSAYDICYRDPADVRTASDLEEEANGHRDRRPLEVSPANREVSRFTDEGGGQHDEEVRPSRRVSPRKGKRVDYGGADISSHPSK
ncbi:hypothetical protein TMEN_7693 [Trichophyton mentagrophytes]|uniref:Assimilatory sulfite reductase n=3 Tax=Trichophyton TaxID=5550 RepID=A0A9P4YHT9_9EURO|nr:hypothetical protein TESG_06661 [Trichophyton tonsurans CBS 112818]EZF32375.1 hypothetical protein H101_04038 [Trichophyton interdigitale H6]KAF3894964.1 Assimilatory sulfite reductase [Trichophyton interdigitale]KDB24381.1 hypothetical protein H109_03767 [Trichophyton interdigitale MR816]GBF64976.1 hypothetical protein TMEN_7693 [Trichophyton mentagrophytes]